MVTMSDTIRMIFTYLIAMTIVVGGGLFLFFTRAEPDAQGTALVVSGFIGAALTFVFGQEGSTRAARQSTAASVSGATLHANGLSGTPPGALCPIQGCVLGAYHSGSHRAADGSTPPNPGG